MTHPAIFLLSMASFFLPLLLLLLLLPRIIHSNHALMNWPLVGMLPSLLLNVDRLHDWLTDVLRGRRSSHAFVFLGPWFSRMAVVVTCNPEDMLYIFKSNSSKFYKDFSETFDILGDGIISATGDSWRIQRKMAHKLFHMKGFRLLVEMTSRDKVEQGLLPLLHHAAKLRMVFDLQDVLHRFTFDSMCTLVFGTDPHCLSFEFPTVPFAKATDDAGEALLYRNVVPRSWWKLLRCLNMGEERKLAQAWEIIDLFINQQISRRTEELRRKTNKEKEENGKELVASDLLTSYIDSQVNDDDDYEMGRFQKSEKFLRDTTANLLVAGKDTSSVALAWFFWLLSKNPSVETNILKELRSIKKKKGLVGVFDFHELEGLVYLHAALCETLRLFPAIPFVLRSVLQQDVLPSGIEVRPGMVISISLYAMGRMEDIWGEDAPEFIPERWISDKGTLKLEHSKFLVFGVGPRICLGKDLALIQMKCVAAAILSNFHVHVMEGQHVCSKPAVVIPMKNGLMVRMTERCA